MAGLSELVKGYIEGQSQQQSKARELADKQARQFEQQFKVRQAQTDAEEAQRQYDLNKQRVEIESRYADIAKQKAGDDAEHKKRIDELNSVKEQARVAIGMGKIDLTDEKAVRDQYFKLKEGYLKAGETPDIAGQLAAQDLSEFQQRMTQPDSYLHGVHPQSGGSAAAPGATQGAVAPTGNPILDMLQQRAYHGVKPPAERPGAMNEQTPAAVLQQALGHAKMDQEKASAEKARADAEAKRTDMQLNAALLRARAGLTEAQRKHVDAMTKKIPFDIAAETANAHAREMSAKAAIDRVKIDRSRETRLDLEAKVKNDPTRLSSADKRQALQLLTTTRDKALRLNEEIIKTVKSMSQLDLQLQTDDAVKASPSAQNTIRGLKAGYAAQLEELKRYHDDAEAEYQGAQALASKYGARIITTPSGNPDGRAQDAMEGAQERAADAARRRAARRTPAPIGLPGMPGVPGLSIQPGTPPIPRVAPRRSAPAHRPAPAPAHPPLHTGSTARGKAKPGKKKDLRSMSTEELMKALK